MRDTSPITKLQLVVDVVALLTFSVLGLAGKEVSAWYVAAWIALALIDHNNRDWV